MGFQLALPSIVRQQVNDVLAKSGYANATFSVDSATIFGTRIGNVRAGKHGELAVSFAKIDYSPLVAMTGRIDAVRIEDANIAIDLEATRSDEAASPARSSFDPWSSLSAAGIPVKMFDLRNCTATLTRGEKQLSVRLDGVLWRETWDGDRARISLQLRDLTNLTTIDGSVDFVHRNANLSMTSGNIELARLFPFAPDRVGAYLDDAGGTARLIVNFFHADGQSHSDGSLDLRDGKFVLTEDYGITLDNVAAALEARSLAPFSAPTTQRIDVKRMSIGTTALDDLHIEFTAPDIQHITISSLKAGFAGGELRAIEPVPIEPEKKRFTITLSASRVELKEFLRLVSNGKVSGEGSLSGQIPVSIEWPYVMIGNGSIRTDAPGSLNFGTDVGEMAGNIAKSDPRLRDQREQIMEALANFQYDQILFDFRRGDDGLKVSARIAGRGRVGNRTPIDLTINYNGLEEALNTYLSATQGVK